MKLDRNINPNGRGKYALINLRRIVTPLHDGYGTITVPESAVTWGGADQFFVIKYKDIFAAAALKAYAKAVRKEAGSVGLRGSPQKKNLRPRNRTRGKGGGEVAAKEDTRLMIPLFIHPLFLLLVLSIGAWTVFVAGWLIGELRK